MVHVLRRISFRRCTFWVAEQSCKGSRSILATIPPKCDRKRGPSRRKWGARTRTKDHPAPGFFRIREFLNPREKDLVLVDLTPPVAINLGAYVWPCLCLPLHLPRASLTSIPAPRAGGRTGAYGARRAGGTERAFGAPRRVLSRIDYLIPNR